MPMIRPLSDFIDHAAEIADFCRQTSEPVLITQSGGGDMVLMSLEAYEARQSLLSAQASSGTGTPGGPDAAQENFLQVARQLRECLSGSL